MKKTLFLILVLIFIIIWFFKPTEKSLKIDLKVNRFDLEVFSLNQNNIIEKTSKWDSIYEGFPDVYTSQILNISSLDKGQYYNDLLTFVKHSDMREAYDTTLLLYSDISDIIFDLELAFGKFAYTFPKFPIPDITFFFGGFNYGVITYDNNIAIGLENFLGNRSKFYQYLATPEYLRFQKQKKFILSNIMEVWFNEHFQKYLGGRDLLSQMIYKGKMMYFLDYLLPKKNLANKFRYTSDQMKWVIDNETNIWEYLIYEDLLFSKNENEFRTFLSYSPFAKGMPREAPGRVAYFIGYKIVCSYMENNKVSIEELMYLNNSQEFLKRSKYKPVK